MGLGKESICSLFVTHLLSPGECPRREKGKKNLDNPVKTPCKHANQTWYLLAER